MAKRSLEKSLSKFDRLERQFEQDLGALDRVASLPQASIDAAANVAAKRIVSDVRKYLLSNYDRSGIGKGADSQSTGKLKRQVGRALVLLRSTSGKLSMRIAMPPGVQAYRQDKKTGGASSSNFYTVAGSLHFGAVRTGRKSSRGVVDLPTGKVTVKRAGALGARAKRTIKKKALGGDVSARAVNAIEAGRSTRTGRTITEGHHVGTHAVDNGSSVSMGGAVVIKPRPFFYLTETQQEDIRRRFREEFSQNISRLLRAAA